MPNCTDLEDKLTHEAFLAAIIDKARHPYREQWCWLCLNEQVRQERLAEALHAFEEWKAMELRKEHMRTLGISHREDKENAQRKNKAI